MATKSPETVEISGLFAVASFLVPQCGGEEGIRTLDTLMGYTRFPIVRARPTTRLLHVMLKIDPVHLSAWLL